MPAQRVGIREFRERLAHFLAAPEPVTITRHGDTVGVFIPTPGKHTVSDLDVLREAAAALDAQLAAASVSEDDLMREYTDARRRRHASA